MRKRSMMILATMAGAILAACSSDNSSAPKPSLAGTWHVNVGPLSSGTLSPSSFDIVLKASGDTFLVTMPAVTWSVGPVTFDSGPTWIRFSGSTTVGVGETATGNTNVCQGVVFYGTENTGRDTLTSAAVAIANADTLHLGACVANATGSMTMTK